MIKNILKNSHLMMHKIKADSENQLNLTPNLSNKIIKAESDHQVFKEIK
jgi:hypothetical protein